MLFTLVINCKLTFFLSLQKNLFKECDQPEGADVIYLHFQLGCMHMYMCHNNYMLWLQHVNDWYV